MNDIEVSSIDLVEGGNVFKQGHYLTLGYVPRDENGEDVDLSGKTLNVSLWGRKGVVFEAAATYSAGVIRFTFDKLVAAGDYTVEFTATSSTDAKYRKKFPTNQHSGRIAIKQSADDLGVVGIQVYTVAQLKAEQKALLDAAVSGFTVDSETKMARVSGTTTHPTIGARLEADKQVLTQQLAEKLKKGEVSVADIDKNKGLIDQTYLSDGLKQQIAGTAPINAVPANKSVTMKKLSFSKVQKNLFDKGSVTSGNLITPETGALSPNATHTASEFIEVLPNESYAMTTNISRYAWYDANKVYISGEYYPNVVVSPANAVFLRASGLTAEVNAMQIEKGTARTLYEPFQAIIEQRYLDLPKPFTLEDRTVTLRKTTFSKHGKNYFNHLTAEANKFLGVADGLTSNHASYKTSEYMPVKPNVFFAFTNVYTMVWYDASKKFISGKTSPVLETSPINAAFLRISVGNAVSEVAQVEEGSKTTFEPYREFIDNKYLDFPDTSQSVGSGDSHNSSKVAMALATENAYKNIPNVKEPLNIPTYDGTNEPVHPSVLYFPNGWNGYKFWMAMTPYPAANNQVENPSIVASNDNITWDVPAPNPIAPLLPENTYQSDPTIFMNGNTMEMWYRVSTKDTATTWKPTEYFRMKSTDGRNWTARELMFTSATFEEAISQTIRMKDGKFCMWYVLGPENSDPIVRYAESIDGKNWVAIRTLDLTIGDGYTFWHGDTIRHDDGRVEMVIMCKHPTKFWAIFYTSSTDNIKFTKPTMIIKASVPGRWDSQNMYRPAVVMVGDEYYVYYSTGSMPFKTGLVKGNSLLSLGLGENRLSEYPALFEAKTLYAHRNAFAFTDTFNKYPEGSIVYFSVWSTESLGWPKLAGAVKTVAVFNEANRTEQYFYPTAENRYYRRIATANGWTAWNIFEGINP